MFTCKSDYLSSFPMKSNLKTNILWKNMFLDDAPCCLVDNMTKQHRLLLYLRRALLPHRFCPFTSWAIEWCTTAQVNRTPSLPDYPDSLVRPNATPTDVSLISAMSRSVLLHRLRIGVLGWVFVTTADVKRAF